MNDIMSLALLGGFFSFASTSTGAFAARFFVGESRMRATRTWLAFGLGVMLSSVAFSLLGPELLHSFQHGEKVLPVIVGTFLGVSFVWILQLLMPATKMLLLPAVLILHNFPEGMGAGASLAGMPLHEVIPIQAGLAVQNIIEGALITMCFLGFGWTLPAAIFGGMVSGAVEWSGAFVAGAGLEYSNELLSPFLAAAGGAMLMSVVFELETTVAAGKFPLKQFVFGLASIPAMNLILMVG